MQRSGLGADGEGGLLRAARRAIVLLPLPLLVVGTGFVFMAARGPHWLNTNFDPAYPYLFNSLRLARIEPPVLTEHPGTPVQAIGAVMIRTLHLAARTSVPLEPWVFRNAEYCIQAAVLVFLLLYGGALVLAGNAVLRATRRVELAWLVQATPFLSYGLFFELVDFKPEPLLCTVSALFVACLAATLGDTPPTTSRLAVVLGVLAGASAATKYLGVSLFAAPLVLVPGLRGKLLSAGAALGSFLALTAPALPEASRSLRFVWKLASSKGLYGTGAYTDMTRLGAVVREEAVFFLVVLASTVAAAFAVLRGRRAGLEPSRRAALRALLALLAVDAVQITLFLKHPYVSRYLVPALGLQGLNLALVARLSCWDEAGRLRRPMAAAMLLALATAGVCETERAEGQLAMLRLAATDQKRARRAAQIPGCATVNYAHSSSPAMALQVGDLYSGRTFREALLEIHPRALFIWEYQKDGRPKLKGRGTLSSEASCFVFQGAPGGPSHPFGSLSDLDRRDFPVEGRLAVVFECPWEAVFRVDPEREAGAPGIAHPGPVPQNGNPPPQ